MKDYYNILGIDPASSDDQIRTAYKKLAMQHHPDRGGDQTKFQEIQEAYSVLSDTHKRAEWEHNRNFQQAGGFNFNFSFGDGNLHDIFRQFHAGPFGGGGFRHQQRNRDIRTQIQVDLESTLDSQTKILEINHNGSHRTVQVNIPRGVQSSMQMRFSGHGDSSIPNAPPGDLYVDFVIRPHPIFNVEGINLIMKKKVNAIDAILGTNIPINGLDNRSFTLNIARGTQHGTQIRFAQQGLWDINHPIRGDLLVYIEIDVPTSITKDQLNKLTSLT